MLRALLLGVLTFASASCSKQADAPAVAVGAVAGKVVELTGKVSATREGKARDLALGAEVFRDDQIATSADATVTIELFHNGAKWSVVSNKQARVDASLAWGLDKQEAAKAVEHNSAAAGRNAERSAADTASTTAPRADSAAPSAPVTESMPAAAADTPPPRQAPKVAKPMRGGPPGGGGGGAQAGTPAAAAPPAPPPPAREEEKGRISAPRSAEPDLDGSAPAETGAVLSPQTLAERKRPALQNCLDAATPAPSGVTLVIDVSGRTSKTTVDGKRVTPKVRACMDGIVQTIEWPDAGTIRVTLKF